MRGNQAIVKMLEEGGVQYIFGLCGDTSLPLYEAFYDLNPKIDYILTRDERSASYMADTYARLSGRVGVCEAPSGGGRLYMVPGLAEANQSSVPVVAFSTDIEDCNQGRGTLTELNADALFQAVTSWANTPTCGENLPRSIREAFRRSTSGGLGAMHISLPLNIQEAEIPDGEVYIDPNHSYYPSVRCAPEAAAVRKIAQLLVESRSPVLVAGAGVIRSEAWSELQILVDFLGCPVATSISGKGAISEKHPLSLGVIGSNGGLAYRHEIVNSSDLVFFIGCRAGSVTTNKWTIPKSGSARVIQMDVDPNVIGSNYKTAASMTSDAKLGLAALNEEVENILKGRKIQKIDFEFIKKKREGFLSKNKELFHSSESPIRPERFLTELFKVMPEDSVVITDAGTPTPYFAAYYELPHAGRWFVAPRAHGALGYALPAALGAYYARPNNKIIAVMGDGSFGMCAGELETYARLQVPVVLIVLANNCYGWIKAGQKSRGGKYFGVDFSAVDHSKVAEAYGLNSLRVEDPKDLNKALTQAMQSKECVLLEVLVQPLHEAKAPVSKWIA